MLRPQVVVVASLVAVLGVARAPRAHAQTTPIAIPVAPVTSIDIARRHAPQYRFNAYVSGHDDSPQNKSEDYFPMSVKSFFDSLASGSVRAIKQEAYHTQPGVSRMEKIGKVTVGLADITGNPRWMTGDAPGTAPVYFHIYPEKGSAKHAADGSGTDCVFVEYWLFYAQDASGEKPRWGPVIDVGGHRGDWELTCFEIEISRGAGGIVTGSEVKRGFYSAHGKKCEVELQDMSFVDDNGDPHPHGGHPLVYVSIGKHASYPEPGIWKDIFGLAPWVIHDEYFRGNGYVWSSWSSRLLDMETPKSVEFSPPSFHKLLSAPLEVANMTDWRKYAGLWGPDKIPHVSFGDSPRGPKHQGSYGSGARCSHKWTDVKREKGVELRNYPVVVPAPVPVRD